MTDINKAAHQPFSWLADDAKDYPMADFVALTVDICNGIHTCLEIVYASDLERSWNNEVDPDEATMPAVNTFDAVKLLQLSIASAWLLRELGDRQIGWINEYGARHLQTMKGRAK